MLSFKKTIKDISFPPERGTKKRHTQNIKLIKKLMVDSKQKTKKIIFPPEKKKNSLFVGK